MSRIFPRTLRALRAPLLSLVCAVTANSASLGAAETRPLLSPIFADHMVLQRDQPNRFWGWAAAGERITVKIGEQSASATAGADGKWLATLSVPPAGGPYVVEISGPQTVTLNDVLVGDVWLCSGQSNMEIGLNYSTGGTEAAAAADRPTLRFCTIGTQPAYAPRDLPRATWKICTPATAGSFSAVAYYFGDRLQRELGIPIGLIQSAVGGSPIESWLSAERLTRLGEAQPELAEMRRLNQLGGEQTGSFLMHWLAEHDPGAKDYAWAQPALDETAWQPVKLPGGFEELGVPETPAVCWFRRTVEVPAEAAGKPAKIFLGEVEKMDTTFVNGRWIGASSWVENPRVYALPPGVLQAGKNLVAIRVFKTKPNGGFRAPADGLRLEITGGPTLPLAGAWVGRLSVDARPPFPPPLDWENYATMPAVFANGMIAPLAPLALTGALWYQGEANQGRPASYRKFLDGLMADWREQFAQPNLPVYIVSLPAFMGRRDQPGTTDGWTHVREAQIACAQTDTHSGLVVTVDVGDAANIHPHDKQPVGARLAAVALAKHYGKKVTASGPVFRTCEAHGAELRLTFDELAGGLVVHGDAPGEFAIAGADEVWHWATARIEGDTVVLSSPEVPAPVAARYAWQANPRATLFNQAGFPAVPFRTDRW